MRWAVEIVTHGDERAPPEERVANVFRNGEGGSVATVRAVCVARFVRNGRAVVAADGPAEHL